MAQLRLACPRSRQSGLQQPEKASVWKKRNQMLATGNGTENMGKALNAPVPVCVLLQSCPRATGRGPSHSHHTIVLDYNPVYPAEVCAHPTPEPKPMSGGTLCSGVFLFVSVFLFVFSSCPPSNPSLWQEMGSCWLAEANQASSCAAGGISPIRMAWQLFWNAGESGKDAEKQTAMFITEVFPRTKEMEWK